MRISDWSSDVCSSDLLKERTAPFDCLAGAQDRLRQAQGGRIRGKTMTQDIGSALEQLESVVRDRLAAPDASASYVASLAAKRSEEHTSELQSLMRLSYAVFCLTNKNTTLILPPS